MTKKDKDGNVVYRRTTGHTSGSGSRKSTGIEMWFEYDDAGNNIYQRNSLGYEAWWEYDEEGRLTHYRNSTGGTKFWAHENDIKPAEWFMLEDNHGLVGGIK